jgi:hypothetical protein
MAKGQFQQLVLQVGREAKRKALQQALLVPWRRLEESASAYADWHIFALWVRSIAEFQDPLPEMVLTALEARCPGLLDAEQRERQASPRQQRLLWHSLEDWIGVHQFAEAKAEGWFDAVMYYAYKDLRTEKAWTLWKRTKNARIPGRPAQWPAFGQWSTQVNATHDLTQSGTETARAVEALARVEPGRLHRAVTDLLEWRAFVFWVACRSLPERPLDQLAVNELRRRCPSFLAGSSAPLWHESSLFRLMRLGEAEWRTTARAEGWLSVLRYQVRHHPRYHRLVHYLRRCLDERHALPPRPYPAFADWLRAADAYFLTAAN